MFPAVLCWMKITKINIYVVTYTHTKHTNMLSWYSETNSMSVRKCNTGVCRVKQSWMLETLSSNHSNKSSSPTGWRPTHPSTHTPTHCHHCLHTHTHLTHTYTDFQTNLHPSFAATVPVCVSMYSWATTPISLNLTELHFKAASAGAFEAKTHDYYPKANTLYPSSLDTSYIG